MCQPCGNKRTPPSPDIEALMNTPPLINQPGSADAVPAGRTSLIDFPCAFPIKVMGAQVPGFEAAMVLVAQQFDAAFDAASVERRPSKAGNYLGLTLTVQATSQSQLDELYRTLSTHPMVKVVL